MKPKFEIGQKVYYLSEYSESIYPKKDIIHSIIIESGGIYYKLDNKSEVREESLCTSWHEFQERTFEAVHQLLNKIAWKNKND